MTLDPLLDPVPPTHAELPSPGLRRNRAFMLLWGAATVSVFGSFVTRIALPFVAIETLRAGPIEIAALRAVDLVAALLVGFVAGAWVDRLRRRPVMIWADLGRAVLLGSIPVAAVGGWLTLAQVLLVSSLAAVLTTFFDVADKAYLPTIVSRAELVRANGALAATSSAVEFLAFGAAGFLVKLLTAPIAIAVDACSFIVSAAFLGGIRRPEPPPPPAADREPIGAEIREGMRIVAHDPVLRGLLWGTAGAVRDVGRVRGDLAAVRERRAGPRRGRHRRRRGARRVRVARGGPVRRAGGRTLRARPARRGVAAGRRAGEPADPARAGRHAARRRSRSSWASSSSATRP